MQTGNGVGLAPVCALRLACAADDLAGIKTRMITEANKKTIDDFLEAAMVIECEEGGLILNQQWIESPFVEEESSLLPLTCRCKKVVSPLLLYSSTHLVIYCCSSSSSHCHWIFYYNSSRSICIKMLTVNCSFIHTKPRLLRRRDVLRESIDDSGMVMTKTFSVQFVVKIFVQSSDLFVHYKILLEDVITKKFWNLISQDFSRKQLW